LVAALKVRKGFPVAGKEILLPDGELTNLKNQWSAIGKGTFWPVRLSKEGRLPGYQVFESRNVKLTLG
jgi:predicted RNA-binding protein (virulence factor B family)